MQLHCMHYNILQITQLRENQKRSIDYLWIVKYVPEMIILLVCFTSSILIVLIFSYRRLFRLKEENYVFYRILILLCNSNIWILIGFIELPLLLKFDPFCQISDGRHNKALPCDKNFSRGNLQFFSFFLTFIFKIFEFRVLSLLYYIVILNFSDVV
jgi:hypothetical protein